MINILKIICLTCVFLINSSSCIAPQPRFIEYAKILQQQFVGYLEKNLNWQLIVVALFSTFVIYHVLVFFLALSWEFSKFYIKLLSIYGFYCLSVITVNKIDINEYINSFNSAVCKFKERSYEDNASDITNKASQLIQDFLFKDSLVCDFMGFIITFFMLPKISITLCLMIFVQWFFYERNNLLYGYLMLFYRIYTLFFMVNRLIMFCEYYIISVFIFSGITIFVLSFIHAAHKKQGLYYILFIFIFWYFGNFLLMLAIFFVDLFLRNLKLQTLIFLPHNLTNLSLNI